MSTNTNKKRINRKIAALLLAFLFLVSASLTGCSQSKAPVEGAAKSNDLTPEQGYIIVTDYYGNKVKVKQNPAYIGSLFAVATHIFAIYGDVDKIVTIPDGNTRDYLFCQIYPQISKARIVKGNNVLNIEEVVKQPRPEVLIANPEVTTDEATVKKLTNLGIPVVTIAYDNIEQQKKTMEMLGTIADREKEAADYNKYYQSVVELVNSRIKDIPDSEKKTVYHAINELLRTDAVNTLSADILDKCGVKNIAFQGPQGAKTTQLSIDKHYIALEELLEANPEYILINGGDVLDYINKSTQLHNLKAYKEKHIYLMPLGVSRWGHPTSIESPLAMLWIAKTIYPDLFADIDICTETKDFYKNYFHYELSDAQVTKILEGREYKDIKGSSNLAGGTGK
ncbi:ABC transporter substrate-binding protein [Dehalobacter sp. DCM]|uniref:ABC transporter substrate-binding protein n=1 Tax=Dehalobacter sp. DCM TaxID=2907827 RepID=UPI00308173CE|nr:ABC transporter substrate-binding protein [Dehalobacter sp. DCM]